jgi:hypothetical protein
MRPGRMSCRSAHDYQHQPRQRRCHGRDYVSPPVRTAPGRAASTEAGAIATLTRTRASLATADAAAARLTASLQHASIERAACCEGSAAHFGSHFAQQQPSLGRSANSTAHPPQAHDRRHRLQLGQVRVFQRRVRRPLQLQRAGHAVVRHVGELGHIGCTALCTWGCWSPPPLLVAKPRMPLSLYPAVQIVCETKPGLAGSYSVTVRVDSTASATSCCFNYSALYTPSESQAAAACRSTGHVPAH